MLSVRGRSAELALAVTAVGFALLLLRGRRRRRTLMQGISNDVDWEQIQEDVMEQHQAQAVLSKCSHHGPLRLVKDARSELAWQPMVEDVKRRSFAYVLRAEKSAHFSPGTLDTWFVRLHPRNFAADGTAWTAAYYRGERLLRYTAWAVLDPACRCEYGYSDTWQACVTDARMLEVPSAHAQTQMLTRRCSHADCMICARLAVARLCACACARVRCRSSAR